MPSPCLPRSERSCERPRVRRPVSPRHTAVPPCSRTLLFKAAPYTNPAPPCAQVDAHDGQLPVPLRHVHGGGAAPLVQGRGSPPLLPRRRPCAIPGTFAQLTQNAPPGDTSGWRGGGGWGRGWGWGHLLWSRVGALTMELRGLPRLTFERTSACVFREGAWALRYSRCASMAHGSHPPRECKVACVGVEFSTRLGL